MEIVSINNDATSDFSLVHLKSDIDGTAETPHCKLHGAMNKITADGIWRCVTVAGFQRVISGNSIGEKHRENICRAACMQTAAPKLKELSI